MQFRLLLARAMFPRGSDKGKEHRMQFVLICLGIGCAMGFLAGLLGVGGGIIAVPCMMYFLKMGPQQAMGTSLAIIVPVAIAGSYKHISQGHVNFKVAACIGITGILLSYFGAWLNHRMDPLWLKRAFAIFIILTGAQMLLSSTPAPQSTAAEPPAVAAEK
jgi:uncharacterized membrane protein YfcA